MRFARRVVLSAAFLAVAPLPAVAGPVVSVTIKPVHSLVASVMQGVGTPHLLVEGAASPHTYAMKPSDAKALNASTVFFRVSESLEPFTRKIVRSLPKHVRVVNLAEAPGIELLSVRRGNTFEAHKHDTEHVDEHRGHGLAHVRDPHVWLDPRNARAMVAQIVTVLSQAAPADAPRFEANATRLMADLETLEKEIDGNLASVREEPFVVFHDAYQYFEARFGLRAVAAITMSPEIQPSARRLIEIRRVIKDLKAQCIFAEPQFRPNLVATVIEGTEARSGTLDPEGASLQPGPDAYAVLLRNLAEGLKSCLASGN
jgi:zinc transport system substrate-binding protein